MAQGIFTIIWIFSRYMLFVHENNWAGSVSRSYVGKSETIKKLRKSIATDRWKPCILAIFSSSQV